MKRPGSSQSRCSAVRVTSLQRGATLNRRRFESLVPPSFQSADTGRPRAAGVRSGRRWIGRSASPGKPHGQIVAYTESFNRGSFLPSKESLRSSAPPARFPRVSNVLSDCDRPHGVPRQVIAALRLGILEDPAEGLLLESEVSQ